MMKVRKKWPTLAQAKEVDIVSYLQTLGYKPAKIRENDYWYHSPLRGENTPSFKVNIKINRWSDYGGDGTIGGNLIDFGVRYHKCSVGEFLDRLGGDFSLALPNIEPPKISAKPENKVTILSALPLTTNSLIGYIKRRNIDMEIVDKYCQEIRYKIGDRTYYGIGFKNNMGGFEIRNPLFKTSSAPKDITTIDNGSKHAEVFEGYTDFLSYLMLYKNKPESNHNFVILNSTNLFDRAIPFMQKHDNINLNLDWGKTGRECTEKALALGDKYKDAGMRYKGFDDFNDWWKRPENMPEQKMAQKHRQSHRQ